MKFFTVCTRPHYGPADVERLLEQLHQHYTGDIDFFVYTDRPKEFNFTNAIPIEHTLCERQWYKVDFAGYMNADIDEPIIVMDVDLSFIRNIDHIIDMPVDRKQFSAIERWWRRPGQPMNINGGMYKYYPSSCEFIFNKFYKNPQVWQNSYRQYSKNPVTGEQYFMWEAAREQLEIVTFPPESVLRLREGDTHQSSVYADLYKDLFNIPLFVDHRYNERVCILHG